MLPCWDLLPLTMCAHGGSRLPPAAGHVVFFDFFYNHPAPPEIYTLSLHDALPIWPVRPHARDPAKIGPPKRPARQATGVRDRKSTRLNSSHANSSYAVFCLKKKKRP